MVYEENEPQNYINGGIIMNDVNVSMLNVDVSAYDMPETEKIDRIVKALAAEDNDTGVEMSGYGVYGVSGSVYGVMF